MVGRHGPRAPHQTRLTMNHKPVISVDAMGGDNAPGIVIEGLALTARHAADTRFLLHGDEAQLTPLIGRFPVLSGRAEIRHTDKSVTMDAKPSQALRASRGSSMWNALESVRSGESHAAVSAGNTGALMAISKIVLRTFAGIHRPAIAATWPTATGKAVVLDMGANVEAGARQLVEFAIMGEAFARAVHGKPRPVVGLLNIGSEELKGRDEIREAARLIRESGVDIAFGGFVEGNDIFSGKFDVVATDGFTGNVALKTAEGTAKLISGALKEALSASLRTKFGALLAMPALKSLRDKLDPRTGNGGVFLGLSGVVVKSHGGTDGLGFSTAVRLAIDMSRSDFSQEIARNLARLPGEHITAMPAEAADVLS